MIKFDNDWNEILKDEFNKDYYKELRTFLIKEYRSKTIYPDMYDIFNALHYTAYKDVKVVILGQDPYHGKGQAHGLSFSVKPGIAPPPSLIILWGSNAQSKINLITNPNHLILKSPHPSPLSSYRGFFGSKPFSKANNFLVSKGIKPVDWQIENLP